LTLPLPKLQSRIYIKCTNEKFLSYRNDNVLHFEASSLIIGDRETIRINNIALNSSTYIINIITIDGKFVCATKDGNTDFSIKDENVRSQWEIYFHKQNLISIRSIFNYGWMKINSKGWLMNDEQNIYNALTKPQSIFETVPWATLYDNNKIENGNCINKVVFAM